MHLDWASYPQPATRLEPPPTNPRPLAKFEAPPQNLLDERLGVNNLSPSSLAEPVPFSTHFIRTRHVVPAAFPHMYNPTKLEKEYELEVPGESNEQRKARLAAVGRLIHDKRLAAERDEVPPNPDASPLMLLEAHRFVRRTARSQRANIPGGGLTLVLAHANGFHKEMWEVVIRRMEEHPASLSMIDEIWTFDAFNHGGSALMNADVLGDMCDWTDIARDYASLVAAYLPNTAGPPGEPGPTVLPRVSNEEVEKRLTVGFTHRSVVGIGHSLGSNTLCRAAAEYGAMWSSLILTDPAMVPGIHPDPSGGILELMMGALSRRSKWQTRAEALELMRPNPFFSAWDPEILSIYVEHGLTEDKRNGGFRLKTSGFQEAVTFCERRTIFETWELLAKIDPNVPIHWMLAGRRPKITGNEEITSQLAWRRSQNCSNVRVPNTGHLVAQEAPKDLADGISQYLQQNYCNKGKINSLAKAQL